MRIHEILNEQVITESLRDYTGGRWVHYTDHDMLTVNSRKSHSDPKGIYFFPENFKPISWWVAKKNCFSVAIKPDARILDLSAIDEEGIWSLVKAVGAEDIFAGYIKMYPPENTHKMLDMAWDMMKQKMMSDTGKWNAILRHQGWDAVFDDTKSIHTSETQLLVLNPSIITDVKNISKKPEIYNKMLKIIDDFRKLDFGDLKMTIENPKRENRYGVVSLCAYIDISNEEYNPESYDTKRKYAKVKIVYDPKQSKDRISIFLQYSNPSLGYGSGTEYNIHTNEYREYIGGSGLDKFRDEIIHVFTKT